MKYYRLSLLITAGFVSIACAGCGGEEPKPTPTDVLKSISITEAPTKTQYKVGEVFDKTGMVVTASYESGKSETIDTFTYEPSGPLTKNDYSITVSVNGFSAFQPITVSGNEPTPPIPGDYYESISDSLTGEDLLDALNKLNNKKRKTTVGYKTMLNEPSKGFYVTDPGTGSSTITTFYSGKNNNGTKGLNREHVWPKSRGGNLVEGDIHMPRPTLNAENGSRGNSFYVEGMCDPENGWDPAMESFGLESYRGDSARIIFYCAIANKDLTLVDKTDDNDNNKTMGKLSDLLKWNLKYNVLERENIRNKGAESLQGNRNPFVDHPEYACRIWGNTNATTKSICA